MKYGWCHPDATTQPGTGWAGQQGVGDLLPGSKGKGCLWGHVCRCSMFQAKRKVSDRIGNCRCRCGAQDAKYPLPPDLYSALISAAPPGARCCQCAHLSEGKTEAQGG